MSIADLDCGGANSSCSEMEVSGSAFGGGGERRVTVVLVIVLGPLRKCVSLHIECHDHFSVYYLNRHYQLNIHF